ncbi:DUF6011 domain-containing protein [Streptomyces sp. SL13]|uniref:DUF6011 domain-containing protein n=1 Tax=Streptantibioticus silvisoli TaxID=2705255 RepID=A0AA90GYV0_9ACTN|nr:DUF6011 domain-containing protein [Streptantibioticus silvisoli]MDI5964345.1 DUF6011 domain-containing protein [Streptantibioticus silvisoli]MDI5968991.1 DUF6011 domain-containing protein [Streptantibioticus silvisoli]
MRQDSPGDPSPDDAFPDDPSLLPGPPPGQRALVTCRLCGRPLTGRAARLRGVGDGCLAKLHERTAPRPPEQPVEQDPLPGI